jgi:hypothetical protein
MIERCTVLSTGVLLVAVATFAVPAGTAGAAASHGGCAPVFVGGSSGWCGLYPGNATDNVQALGQVSVSAEGTSLVVQTEDASSGAAPQTSFACLVPAQVSDIEHRLQDVQCTKEGGGVDLL